MAQIQIPWTTGGGNITLTFTGQGNGTIVVTSDDNSLNVERRQTLTISGGGLSRQVTVIQLAKPATPSFTGLKFTALAAGAFSLTIGSDITTTNLEYVEYSLDDGVTWTRTNNVAGETVVITTPTIAQGDTVCWRGKGLRMASSNSGTEATGCRFRAESNFEASGNIMSLLYEDWDNVTSVNTYAFAYLFYYNNKIKTAPEFPATTVATHCYNNTFRNCTGLVTGPSIFPAKTLASNCYNSTFRGCSSLTSAPVLPAKTLVANCYIYLFRDCSSLNYIKALFTTTPGSSYTSSWVSGVAANGTFVKNSAATWTNVGVNAVPSGWTIQTANE